MARASQSWCCPPHDPSASVSSSRRPSGLYPVPGRKRGATTGDGGEGGDAGGVGVAAGAQGGGGGEAAGHVDLPLRLLLEGRTELASSHATHDESTHRPHWR